MPEQVTIEIDVAAAQAVLRRLADPAMLQTVMKAAGQEVRDQTIHHFDVRETEAERTDGFPKFGESWGKKGFWSGAHGESVAEAVGLAEYAAEDASVTIRINSRKLAHKADPNPPPITPKGGKQYLAIPANARAAMWAGNPGDYNISGGMRVGYAPDASGRLRKALVAQENYLRIVTRGKNAGQRALAAAGKGTLGAALPQFWLVRQVRTPYDPKAMPDAGVLTERATSRADKAMEKLTKE